MLRNLKISAASKLLRNIRFTFSLLSSSRKAWLILLIQEKGEFFVVEVKNLCNVA